MVYQYLFGKPLDTEAVVSKEVKEMDRESLQLYFTCEKNAEKEGSVLRFTRKMDKSDIVYGLGENVRGINKRGWIYESKCSDNPCHREDTKSLYGAHNFLILWSRRKLLAYSQTIPAR